VDREGGDLMFDGLRRRLRQLSGASDEELIGLLLDQVDATVRGARLARAAVGPGGAGRAREEMRAVEHEGDRSRAELVERLGRSLVTPIDREDLFRLSRSVDDVLDNLRDFVREADLFGVGQDDMCVPLIEGIVDGVEALGGAVAKINAAPDDVGPATVVAKRASNRIRRGYQEAVAELLNDTELDRTLLKRRELLRRLDVVGLRLGEAADALADGLLKRGY
jgi:hypothetical protein